MNLSTSEARAEAGAIVLYVLLAALTPAQLARVYTAARGQAQDIGMEAIEEEVAWICRDAGEATADMLARDGCG